MIAQKQLDMKDLFLLAFTFAASFFLFTSCLNVDEDFVKPQLIFLHEGEIVFQQMGLNVDPEKSLEEIRKLIGS